MSLHTATNGREPPEPGRTARRRNVAKTRVHELAKSSAVESKDVLEKLKEMGEFVKSPSSTIEPPVEMKFKKQYGDALLASPGHAAPQPPRPSRPRRPPSQAGRRPLRPPSRTGRQAARGRRRGARRRAGTPPRPAHARARGARCRGRPRSLPRPRSRPRPPRRRRRCRRRAGRRRQRGPSEAPAPRARSASPPGAPRPGNNPFASSQGMGRRPAPAPERDAYPPRAATRSVRRARRARPVAPLAPACRAPTRR